MLRSLVGSEMCIRDSTQMKRSRVNEIIRQSDDFIQSFGFRLPSFAYWSPQQLKDKRSDISAIIDARLGWDITDFGHGDFENLGLMLFTTRNGNLENLKSGSGMCYAEKIMISRHDQIAPMHRHITKTEDIINRGGATLVIKMFESNTSGELDESAPVIVACDGEQRQLSPGDTLLLQPGQSVTLHPGNWHEFWGEGGDVLIGEVSTVNDDLIDNIFQQPIGRFSDIEEDEDPVHLLVSDYDKWLA